MNDEFDHLMRVQRKLVDALNDIRSRIRELNRREGFRSSDYRIALRPDDRAADPLDHMTLMDDIVVNQVPMFRAEQMGRTNWWA